MKLRGNDMTLMVQRDGKWRAIAYATTCELDVQAEMLEVGSSLTGQWRHMLKRRLQWMGSTGHLMTDVRQEADIMEMVMSADPVTICMGSVQPHPMAIEADGWVLDGRVQMKGEAYVSRATVSARRGDVVTISAEFTGNGELEITWG
jgi:predicted secreted protein